MPGAVVIKKPKSRGEIAKSKSKANLDRRTKQNMKNSVTRPKQKQKPKKKSKFTKIVPDTIKSIGKKIKSAISGGGSKSKASEIKRKDKPKMQEGQAYQPTRTSNRQPGIKKANERKETSREYVTRHAGVTSKMPKAKDSQVMKAEAARRKRAKDKAAKKKERDNRADVRDAKRGGFITAKAAKTAGRKANEKVAANKKRRSDELVSRGRK